jgi:hypothetical protein
VRAERLEERVVPVTQVLDLTGATTQGMIQGAIFRSVTNTNAGSGVLDSFVRIDGKAAVEQGYNTSVRPVQFDENTTLGFTHSQLLAGVSSSRSWTWSAGHGRTTGCSWPDGSPCSSWL